MAAGINCDNHEDTEAKFIIGNADTGEQSFFCPVCVGTFGLVMALAVLDPADVVTAAQDRINEIAGNGAGGPAERPARKSRPKKTAQPPAERSDLAELPEEPAASEDQ